MSADVQARATRLPRDPGSTPRVVEAPPRPGGALAVAVARLTGMGVLDLRLGVPEGGAWTSLPAAIEDAPRWHAELTRQEGDARTAAVYLATWLAAAPALVVGLPALLDGVVPDLDRGAIHLRRDPLRGVDAYAIHPSAATTGLDEALLDDAATAIADLTAPLVTALCRDLPVSVGPVWGGVADALASYALWFARETATDADGLWGRVQRLLDRLAAVSALRIRPALLPVTWSGGTDHFVSRGTCCLYYRTCGEDVGRDARYCATCPLRTREERTALLAAHLDPSG